MTAAQVSQVMAGQMTLADLRKLSGKTQDQVAEAMGKTRVRVAQIETQFPRVMFPVLVSYMEALGGDVWMASGGEVLRAEQVVEDPSREDARRARLERTRSHPGAFA